MTFRGLRCVSRGVPPGTMRVLGSHAIVLLLDGEGVYADELGRRQRITPGDLIVVFPDVAHRYAPEPAATWLESYIVFDGPVFDLWRRRRAIDERNPVWRLEPVEYWERRLNAVVGAQRVDEPLPHRLIEEDEPAMLQRICLLQQFLADARAHQHQRAVGDEQQRWLTQAKAAIDQAPAGEPIDWQRLAGSLSMSYETFRKRFAQLAGVPPARYRMGRLMDAAAEILQREPDTKLRAVAQRLGFCDEFHFSRRFRQVVGMWPSAFRQRVAK